MSLQTAGILLVALLVLISGCVMATTNTAPPPKVYVTPCNVASKGIQVRVNSEALDTKAVKEELQTIFVDDFKSPASKTMNESYKLDCYWGNYIGERRDYYYCSGSYDAPEMDESLVIKRFLLKEFKIGFSVEEHNIGSWVDSGGQLHKEGSVFYLTSRTVESVCSVI